MAKKKKAASNTLEIQNATKTMLANIRFASVDNPMQSIVLTSAVPNEGKTTTTIELAKSIASAGNSVLLVEADMRRRSAASMLGVHAIHGAYAVMSHALTLREAVVATGIPNFYFLDTEPNIPNPADLLSSRAYAKLVDDACNSYDYVLFDTPPVGTFVDAAILSRLVDGVILVVKIGGAKRDEILTAYDQLQKAGAHIIGACATFCEGTGSEYYYAYYNKDNQRVNPEKEARRAQKKGESGSMGAVAPAAPAIPRGPRRQAGQPGQHQSAHAQNQPSQQRVNQAPQVGRAQRAAQQAQQTQQARTLQAQDSNQPTVNPVSNSQAWKKSAVAAGVQQARRSNTPRIDRSQGKRH